LLIIVKFPPSEALLASVPALGQFKGSLAMRLRLSDAASFAVLAEHYSSQAQLCHQMARVTVSPFKEGWLELAAEWTKLKREIEAKAALERQ